MPNVDKVRGFWPVQTLNGGNWDGRIGIYYVPATDATAIFKGDFVSLVAGGDPTGKYPIVTQAAGGTGNALLGVVVGFGTQPQLMAQLPDLSKRYRLASEALYLAVVDDPNVIYEGQEDGDTTPLAATDVSRNATIIVGAGNTDSGFSGMEIDSTSVKDLTDQLRLLRLANKVDNEIGAFAQWYVRINENQLRDAVL